MCLTDAVFASGSRDKMSALITGELCGTGSGAPFIELDIDGPPGAPEHEARSINARTMRTMAGRYQNGELDAGASSATVSWNFVMSNIRSPLSKIVRVSTSRWPVRICLSLYWCNA